ncbi:hypothetical protein VMUT_0070 [Vulcanisaeta moutnovskia 768-28]|uniref:Uncharacterized protein n=1 Tax=Vulcanisaeta moutnovskia (strain 768-28) TaxID=985053 RepID=F0QSD6_VULM7|nr:hypothetical protein [Vulcanisaeta moutnovskia]ADY00287.1 hypothetical protein VMUT_0070 [Vulcanisaeta moutnovskia 768-28]
METSGGEVEAYFYRDTADLELALEDRQTKPVRVNVIVNPSIYEVSMSDYVTSLLGIVLLDVKKGLWRLADEDKVRTNAEPMEWI